MKGIFLIGHQGIVHDDDLVTRLYQQGGGTVQFDLAAAPRPFEDVGLKALTIVAIGNRHHVVDAHPGGIQKVLIDGDRADVVGQSRGNRGPVNLAVEDVSQHMKMVANLVTKMVMCSGMQASEIARALIGAFPTDALAIAPQHFQVIVGTRVWFKQVHHHIDKVGKNPRRAFIH